MSEISLPPLTDIATHLPSGAKAIDVTACGVRIIRWMTPEASGEASPG